MSTVAEQAEFVAQMAPHPSVTRAVLADEESRLAGQPPVTYLDDAEAPAYVLTNGKRGVALGTKRNQTTPDKGRGTVILVTGRRTVCLVGTAPDDEVGEVPHTDVAAVEYHTGLLAKRLELRTPQRSIHCWVGRNTESSLLEEVATYVEDRAEADEDDIQDGSRENGQTAPDHDGEEDSDTVMYRGRPVDRSFIE
jgi:hypothetical protein